MGLEQILSLGIITEWDTIYRLTGLQPTEFVELVKLLEPAEKEQLEHKLINYPISKKDRTLDCTNALLYLSGLDGNSFAVLAAWYSTIWNLWDYYY